MVLPRAFRTVQAVRFQLLKFRGSIFFASALQIFPRAENALGRLYVFLHGQKMRRAGFTYFFTGRKCAGQALRIFS